MAKAQKRSTRVADQIREEITLLLQRTIKDPRAEGVIVSRVEVTEDLRNAKVYFRLLMGGDDAAKRKNAMAGLVAASGKMRQSVGKQLGIRHSPELNFFYDEGLDASMRIEAILQEIKQESNASSAENELQNQPEKPAK